jgi:phospholipid-translocating ATPase
MTESKERIISLKTFGLGWLVSGKPSRKARKENEILEQHTDGPAPRQDTARKWWGAKKVKMPPVTAPGGGSVEKAKEEGKKEKKPAFVARHTEYDELTDDEASGYGGRDGRPKWKDVSWEDLKVGDFVKLENNEAVPAGAWQAFSDQTNTNSVFTDIIICSTSEDEDVAYVETKNLDGETNLKSRHAVPELASLRTGRACTEARFYVESDAPTVDMFKYNAAVTFQDGQLDKDGRDPLRVPVTLNTVLLRGTVIRNTDWIIGVVMATGIDAKIVLNSGGTPSKRSKVERQMNPMVFLNLLLLALMCIMCAVGDAILEHRYYRQDAYWGVFATLNDDNPRINGVIAFANAMITFQNIVPISLYISIEFVKLLQAFFIWADDDILQTETGRRTAARSWNLSDDLGQIEYIFSDKTGTLTQNVMQFRHCTIGGKVYKGDGKVPDNVIVEKQAASDNSESTSSTQDSFKGDGVPKVRLAEEVAAPFHDSQLDADLAEHDSAQARLLFGFFVNLALCHTVLAADDGEGNIQYKAQSPDEAALVQAAADVGFIFLGRDRNLLKLQTPADPEPVEYELLNVIEFSSARKRMSVLIRKVDDTEDRIYVLLKGADNVIFERLAPGQEESKHETNDRLDEFANEGLRTLTLAYREIDEATYKAWEREYNEASTSIDNREDEMERVADKIEREATLLGATAIEDKLQDGVPECLADLKRAGIKVWVCTGDKLETAVGMPAVSVALSS